MNTNTMDVETMIAIKRQMETQSHMICNRKTLNDIQLSRTKIDHNYRHTSPNNIIGTAGYIVRRSTTQTSNSTPDGRANLNVRGCNDRVERCECHALGSELPRASGRTHKDLRSSCILSCDYPESEHTRPFVTECCHEMCLECLMEEGRALHDLRVCDKKVLEYSKIYYSVVDYIVKHCAHEIVEDTIDIDGDRSQTVCYCRKCELNAGDISSDEGGV